MKQKKLRMIGCICGLGLLFSSGAMQWTASATTVSDVIAYAYEVGLPESTIQQCINQYSGGTYTSEQCDAAIAALASWAEQRDSAIDDVLENDDTTSATANADSDSVSETTTATAEESSSAETTITTVTTETPTEDEFIDMSLEEKVSYVNSLSEDERTEFIENMSTDVRNSFLKQLDTDTQLEIVASLVDVGDALGVSFSVDDISDGSLAISARDADGNLVDVTTFGNTVEETGISYTKVILLGGGAILLAAVGFVVILRIDAKKSKQQ